ncbi:MAG: permease [Candidatus Eremiobacteraeota bacterium]|nr:permease [Candidatus Eremiobacteraeota bacterium]
MAVSDGVLVERESTVRRFVLGVGLFLAIAIIGLIIVKWLPYWHKSLVAAQTHSIGASIVSGKAVAPQSVGLVAAWQYAVAYFIAVWQAVVLALLIGASIQVFVPRRWLLKLIGSDGAKSAAVASAASLAGMMCTCCAAPIVVGLRRQRASMGSAIAFFLGNPVLNPATLVFIGFVLGWAFAGIRLAFGLGLVALAAWIANRYARSGVTEQEVHTFAPSAIEDPKRTPLGIAAAWFKELWFEIYTLLPGYIIIVLILGGLRAWLFPPGLTIHASGVGAVAVLALVGSAFVIPTAGEVPIIQTLLHAGMGPGPATALLITLPAISIPSLFIVRKVFPARLLVAVFGCVIAVGIVAGIVAMAVFAGHA